MDLCIGPKTNCELTDLLMGAKSLGWARYNIVGAEPHMHTGCVRLHNMLAVSTMLAKAHGESLPLPVLLIRNGTAD